MSYGRNDYNNYGNYNNYSRRRIVAARQAIWSRFAAAFFPALLSLCLIPFFTGCSTVNRVQEAVGVERQDWPDAAAALAAYLVVKPSGSDLITAGLTYIVVDPLAPNWQIEETRVGEDIFYLRASMKRHTRGGEGEAARLFRRRAEQIQRELGYADYRLLDYSEGIESRYTGAERFGEGRIQLVRH